MNKKILVTSALPYANGYIHLGHCAGAYLPADLFVRYKRLMGDDVLYVCGSDEHGVAITIAAEKEGVTPKDIIDKYHNSNKDAFEKFGMSFDVYSRTSIPEHHEVAKEFFKHFLDKGYLHEEETEQFYDEDKKMFLPDRYVEGTCPNCGEDNARGDQCDNCGAYYNQTELKNPVSLISGKTPTLKKTTHWYFKFGEIQSFLEEYIESNSNAWKDNVLQQTRSWLKQGLSNRAITRDLKWGVHLDEIEGMDKEKTKDKVLYVWFDAVLGYISATKKYFGGTDEWKEWWQNEDTEYYAFIGKDNIVFHTLIFPAMLHGRKDSDNPYILPKNVPAHEFLNLEGNKFSKSRNWSIDLKDFVDTYTEPSMIDALRYSLAMNFPETRDADFTWKDYQARSNNELAAILGNFINRQLTFLHKNYDGKVPTLSAKYASVMDYWCGDESKEIEENDKLMIDSLKSGIDKISQNYDKFRFRDAITETMNIARAANKYFNDEEPWKSGKTDPEKAEKTMFVGCQVIRSLSILFAPILPYTSAYVQSLFGEEIVVGDDTIMSNVWASAGIPMLETGTEVRKPEILFKRIEDEWVEAEKGKLGDKKATKKQEEEQITFDEFMKVKLKTAKVIEAEPIKKSKKLVKLQVKIGEERRQIIAGISQHYSAEELVGKTVVVVANLAPAKLMGEKSEGMLLAVNSDDGGLALVSPEKEVADGQEVR
ncbi:MAG: methionine--tRNA ligase [Chlorobiota bacterium]